jgi:ATP-dependent DNA ligase
VIGGYRPLANSVDAILVGYYEGGDLRFAAKVRAGFIPHVRREVYAKLKPLATTRCPFADLPSEKSRWGGGVGAEEMRAMGWVRPQLVAQVRFVEWTADGQLRHSVFLGLRTDKHAKDVRARVFSTPSPMDRGILRRARCSSRKSRDGRCGRIWPLNGRAGRYPERDVLFKPGN